MGSGTVFFGVMFGIVSGIAAVSFLFKGNFLLFAVFGFFAWIALGMVEENSRRGFYHDPNRANMPESQLNHTSANIPDEDEQFQRWRDEAVAIAEQNAKMAAVRTPQYTTPAYSTINIPGVEFYPAKKPEKNAFERIIGAEKAKTLLIDAVEIALNKNPEWEKYKLKPNKGVLLYGPPGTGKTSFARAAADYFGVSAFVVNASSLLGPYVGTSEQNLLELFRQARSKAPSIIFFDEIDAIGKKRQGSSNNSASDILLNLLLTQLDGFQQNENVFVIGATNRLDILDEALLRPGRFTEKIELALPNEIDREKLFRLNIEKRFHDMNVDDYKQLARVTQNLSPADIEQICDKAAWHCAKKKTPLRYEYLIEEIASSRSTA